MLPLTLNSVMPGVKWLSWASACPQKRILGSQQSHGNYVGISKGRIWPTLFNYLKFQGYLQNMGQSPIKAKQYEEKDIPECLCTSKLHPLLSSKHINSPSDQRGYWFRQGRGNIYLSTWAYGVLEPPNSLQPQQSYAMGENSLSFQP